MKKIILNSRDGRYGYALQSLLLCSLLVMAAGLQAADVPGAADAPELRRYPLSQIVEYSQLTVPQYQLALGRMKKVDGVISPEPVRYISGQLTRITYRIPDGHSSTEAFEHVLKQLQDTPHEVLYRCASRDCGSSNDWANAQFGISKLYGLDGQQHYMAVKLTESDVYLVFYAVQRGNKRVYLHLDIIRPEATSSVGSSSSLLQRLQRGERVYVTSADPGAEALLALSNALKTLLTQNPLTDVWLVGHRLEQNNPYVTLQNNSRIQAEGLRSRLVALGVPENQLQVVGVGALAPSYDEAVPQSRIELIVE